MPEHVSLLPGGAVFTCDLHKVGVLDMCSACYMS